MNIKIHWTSEKKEAVVLAIHNWIMEHSATSGEVIMQSDECNISAPDLLSDIVDDIIKPECIYDEE